MSLEGISVGGVVYKLDYEKGLDGKPAIGDLDDLETEDKSSIVSAINEIAEGSGGSGITPELRSALLTYFYHVTGTFDDEHGQDYIDDVIDALGGSTAPTGITLSANTLSFDAIESKTLTATLVPSYAVGTITWESSDSTVATVSGGEVTAVANGTCTITASCGNVSATCAVTVDVQQVVYTITQTLTGCTSTNNAQSISAGGAYNNNLSVNSGYEWDSVAITMGGVDVTATAYNSGTGAINIASVSGNIVITATATEVSHVLYQLPQETVFDGTSYVDTNLVVCGTGNLYSKDFSIAHSFTVNGAVNGSDAAILYDIANTNRFASKMTTALTWRVFVSASGENIAIAAQAGYPATPTDDTIKIVITHIAGENKIHLYGISVNAGTLQNVVITGAYGNLDANIPYTLLIGGKYDADSSGNKVATFVGTVHDFTVYDEILADSDISTYLGVDINA